MTGRARGWCLTLNNYSEEEYNNLISELHSCTPEKWIIGKEVGKSGTPHLQGYIYMKNAKSLSSMRKMQSKAHWEIAKGNPDQNYQYCSKEGSFESHGWSDGKKKKPKFGGYTCIEEQVLNEPMICEQRWGLNERMANSEIEKNGRHYDEPYEDLVVYSDDEDF